MKAVFVLVHGAFRHLSVTRRIKYLLLIRITCSGQVATLAAGCCCLAHLQRVLSVQMCSQRASPGGSLTSQPGQVVSLGLAPGSFCPRMTHCCPLLMVYALGLIFKAVFATEL